MKYIYLSLIATVLLFVNGCSKEYSLSTGFTVPTELSSPEKVELDVKSLNNIIFSRSGGGADDGAYVQYEVLFVRKGGDFSNPVEKVRSDDGAKPKLSLKQEKLNEIAGKAGLKPKETGDLSWTVVTSKGGDSKIMNIKQDIEVTRDEGIDNIPEKLYLYGSGNESGGTNGSPFREASEKVYVIYTKISGNGEVQLKGMIGDNQFGYHLEDGKLKDDPGIITLAPNANPYRITVNFKTMSVEPEVISSVRCIWGATFGLIGNLEYTGNGKFVGNNCKIQFIDPSKPETNPPGWLSWIEERYYFIATIDGTEKCWGRMEGVSTNRPTGNEPLSFYEIKEYGWSQWEHLWKMKGDLDSKKATITIDTNKENLMIHEFSNITNL